MKLLASHICLFFYLLGSKTPAVAGDRCYLSDTPFRKSVFGTFEGRISLTPSIAESLRDVFQDVYNEAASTSCDLAHRYIAAVTVDFVSSNGTESVIEFDVDGYYFGAEVFGDFDLFRATRRLRGNQNQRRTHENPCQCRISAQTTFYPPSIEEISNLFSSALDRLRADNELGFSNDFVTFTADSSPIVSPSPSPQSIATTPRPSPMPTPRPTPNPTPRPTPRPTPDPTPRPTPRPTPNPTKNPTPDPTVFFQTPAPIPEPTPAPIPDPTPAPIPDPTPAPNNSPSPAPIPAPTGTSPSPTPTPAPTSGTSPSPNPISPSPVPISPTPLPTRPPTRPPTKEPTMAPTSIPTLTPTAPTLPPTPLPIAVTESPTTECPNVQSSIPDRGTSTCLSFEFDEVLANNDFESGGNPGWENFKRQSSDSEFTKFMGRYNKDDKMPARTFNFGDVRKMRSFYISFKFYEIDSWDGGGRNGPDNFKVLVQGDSDESVDFGSFSFFRDDGPNSSATTASGIRWFRWGDPPKKIDFLDFDDQIHTMLMEIPRSFFDIGKKVKITLNMSANGELDEFMGIDDFKAGRCLCLFA